MDENGSFKENIEELKTSSDSITWKIEKIGSKEQAGKEEIRVKFRLFETDDLLALIYIQETWPVIKKKGIK